MLKSKLMKMRRASLWVAWLLPLILFTFLFLCQGYRFHSRQAHVSSATVKFCLTSTPSRLREQGILDNIFHMQQLEVLDGVVLSLPWTYKKTGEAYVVPHVFSEAPKLRILRCEDEGPATKLLAPLRDANISEDHIIIVGDDDLRYKEDALDELATSIKGHPAAVHTMCQKKIKGFLSFGAYKKTLLPLLSASRPAACDRVDDDFFMAALEKLGIPLCQVKVQGCLSFCRACVIDIPAAVGRMLTDRSSLVWEDVVVSDQRKRSVQQCFEAMSA